MGKWCLHASLFLGNKDMFKNYKRFDFWHLQTADIGGTKPWKNNCSLIWKLFKFLMTLLAGLFEMRGCWHIGLRWAIVALWATCFKKLDDENLLIYLVWPNDRLMCPNGADGMANNVDPDQTAPLGDCSSRRSLIWVSTVCPDMCVWKLRIITVSIITAIFSGVWIFTFTVFEPARQIMVLIT